MDLWLCREFSCIFPRNLIRILWWKCISIYGENLTGALWWGPFQDVYFSMRFLIWVHLKVLSQLYQPIFYIEKAYDTIQPFNWVKGQIFLKMFCSCCVNWLTFISYSFWFPPKNDISVFTPQKSQQIFWEYQCRPLISWVGAGNIFPISMKYTKALYIIISMFWKKYRFASPTVNRYCCGDMHITVSISCISYLHLIICKVIRLIYTPSFVTKLQ